MGEVNAVGFRYVWFFLIACTATGTLLLSPKVFKELYPHAETTPLLPSHQRAGYQAVPGK
jgi:hypothetical protein